MAHFRLRTLGSVGVLDSAGDPVPLALGKAFALLVYAAVSGRLSRDDAARLFWPKSSRESARHSVRQALLLLRRTLGEDAFASEDPIVLAPDAVAVDVLELRQALAAGDVDRVADRLYHGPFLDGFRLPGSAAWEEWVEEIRAETVRTVAAALHAHGDARRAENLPDAAALLRRATSVEPHEARHWTSLVELLLELRSLDEAADALRTARGALADLDADEALDALDARLQTLRASARAANAASTRPVLEFVGRTREFASLLDRWRTARAGTTAVAVVSGATGIGKTRLLDEVAAAVGDASVLRVEAAEAERTMEWALVADLVRRLLPLRGAAGISGGSDRVLRTLLPSLGGAGAAVEVPSVALADAVADLVSAVADEAPLLLFVDDLHWADTASRSLLARVLRQLRDAPCLVVLTYRSEDASEALRRMDELLGAELDALRLRLSPLSRAEVLELLTLMADVEAPDVVDRVATSLYEATRGNPLFLAETLHSLEETGVLELEQGRWRIRPGRLPERLELPATIRAVVDQRLSRLGEDAAMVAAQMAALPRDGTLGALRQASGLAEGAFVRAVEELVEREIVAWMGDERLGFTHDQLRQAAARRLSRLPGAPRRRRRTRLALVGAMLAIMAGGAAVLSWAGLGRAAAARYGGGLLYFVGPDSVLVADPAAGNLQPHEAAGWTPRGARHAQVFRTTSGELVWYSDPMQLEGGPYIVRATPAGDRVIVAPRKWDTEIGSPSPDGRFLVYQTENTATPGYDFLIVVSRADGSEPRVIYRTAGKIGFLGWSPDGRTIALVLSGRRDTLAILSPLGERLTSFLLPNAGRASWCGDSRHLAGVVQDDAETYMVMVDVRKHAVERVPGGAALYGPVACSPDASALVYEAAVDGWPALVLHDLRSGERERIPIDPSAAQFVQWVPDRTVSVPEQVQVFAAPSHLRIGERGALRARVSWSDGSVRTDSVAWTSRDPSVASVTGDGEITANRAGRTFVVGTAGGWVQDSVAVTVEAVAGAGLLLYDDFAALDTTQWVVIGAPGPTVSRTTAGTVLSMRGDGNGTDGLLSRQAFALRRGGTVEAEFRFHLTRPDRQRFSVCFVETGAAPRSDPQDLDRWGERQHACFAYPGDELARFDPRVASFGVEPAVRRLRLPPDFHSDRWTRVTLTMRPDGYVAMSVDGGPEVLSQLRLRNDAGVRWRVRVSDAAVDTDVQLRGVSLRAGAGR